MFRFLGSYGDAAQFPTCYLSSVFTLGFVAPEIGFCFVDVLPNAIAEIRSGDAQSTSISPFHNDRTIPKDGSGTFELSQ